MSVLRFSNPHFYLKKKSFSNNQSKSDSKDFYNYLTFVQPNIKIFITWYSYVVRVAPGKNSKINVLTTGLQFLPSQNDYSLSGWLLTRYQPIQSRLNHPRKMNSGHLHMPGIEHSNNLLGS